MAIFPLVLMALAAVSPLWGQSETDLPEKEPVTEEVSETPPENPVLQPLSRNLIFLDTAMYTHRAELYGNKDHDLLDFSSAGIQLTYFRSFSGPGIFVQSTLLFPYYVISDPSPGGTELDQSLGTGFRLGVDSLAGAGWVFILGPITLMAGGGAHFSWLQIDAGYSYGVGLGLTGRIIVPFTRHFHIQLGGNLSWDFYGDTVYDDYIHHFYQGFSAGISAGAGFAF